jgi:hypothetical protein
VKVVVLPRPRPILPDASLTGSPPRSPNIGGLSKWWFIQPTRPENVSRGVGLTLSLASTLCRANSNGALAK